MANPKKFTIAGARKQLAKFAPKSVEERAQLAWDSGNAVFAPKISDWPDGDQGQVIEMVESIGWKLEHWAVVYEMTLSKEVGGYGYSVSCPVFRR